MKATWKLIQKLGSEDLAQKLTDAGLRNPGKIKRATNKAIEAAVGRRNVAAVRAVFPKK